MISIIDYQCGNLGAILNMLKRIGIKARITSNPDDLQDVSRIILPGVGTFDTGMRNLTTEGWIDPLRKKVIEQKIPVLGICLGMQLMTRGSEEGNLEGLGWIGGYTNRFSFENSREYKVPHMGWNRVMSSKESEKLPFDRERENRFYFAHAYHVTLENSKDELLQTTYGKPFTSAFLKENILGVQFHPEKSHRYGMELLRNFANNF